MSIHPASEDITAYKVGAVILRRMDTANPEVLICQPKPNPDTPDDPKRRGLVRGTRMYFDAESKSWKDAPKDGLTAPNGPPEPLLATLQREMEEEAGVSAPILEGQHVYDMGMRTFGSSSKDPYPIHWYAVVLDESAEAQLPHENLKDSIFTRWHSLHGMQHLVSASKMNASYIPIVEDAIAGLRKQRFSEVASSSWVDAVKQEALKPRVHSK